MYNDISKKEASRDSVERERRAIDQATNELDRLIKSSHDYLFELEEALSSILGVEEITQEKPATIVAPNGSSPLYYRLEDLVSLQARLIERIRELKQRAEV